MRMFRNYFPSIKKYNKLIFCDNAGGSQVPRQVISKTSNFLVNNYVQPNSNNILSKKMKKDLDNINNITNIIFNKKRDNIIFGSSASQLFYNVANSIDNGLINNKNIILPNFSHESCISPFERVFKNNNGNIRWWNLDNNYYINYDKLLNKIDKNTTFIVLPHVSNILGNILDISLLNEEIKKKNKNIKVIVDGVAYLPHDIIDIHKFDVDFYCVSFYKFCGLRISGMYIKNINEIYNQNHIFFDKSNDSVKKLEIGGWNFESASSILGLKDYFRDIKNDKFNRNNFEYIMKKIKFHEKNMRDRFYKNMLNNNEIEIIECKSREKLPIFSIIFNNFKNYNVNLILNELGLICSHGTYYCDRLFDELDLCKKDGTLRISLMHYNTIEEVDKITKYLNMFKKYKLNFNFNEYYYEPSIFLQDSFNYLDIDKYYNELRYRGFSLININDINNLEICGNLKFHQSLNYNNYNGNNLRDYKNIDSNILLDDSFKEYIKIFKNKLLIETKENHEYIQVHQIRVNGEYDCTELVPEGIHKDGFNIIGIVVINRVNIKDGINNIYDNLKKNIYSKTMLNGCMIILNDNDMYHDVSNIKLIEKDKLGYRDVFVFTSIC